MLVKPTEKESGEAKKAYIEHLDKNNNKTGKNYVRNTVE